MKTTFLSSVSCRLFTAIAIVALALARFPATPAYAASLVVTTNADNAAVDGACSLREAIANANNDAVSNADCIAGTGADIITFNAGMTITLGSSLPNISDVDGLTIDGGNNVTISGNSLFRITTVAAGVPATFQNITLTAGNGSNGNGGAINNNGGNLTVTNTTFLSNFTTGTGDNGGAIYNQNTGTLSIASSTFTSNSVSVVGSSSGGAVYAASGTVSITGSTFTTNSATLNGGAVSMATGTLSVTGSVFSTNTAGAGGGAIYHNSGTLLTVTNSTFTGNTVTISGGDGGAIMLDNAASSATISGSTFTSNTTEDDGGAIFNDGGPFIVNNSTFGSNSAGAGAGATNADGGAIRNTASSVSAASKISLSTFINNSITMAVDQTLHGGAIVNDGTLIIANVTFSGNSLTKSTATAGAGSTFGGAVYATGTTTVHNATFSGNTVSENGAGTGSGGSIYSVAGAMTIANSIVANGTENGAAGNCGGTITNGGNNVDFNGGDCGFAITANPNLGGLTGSPQYFPLTSGSSAIDTGSNAICATASSTNNESQNGLTRPLDGDADGLLTCDIGSYEAPTLISATITTITADTPDPSVTGETVAVTVTVTGGFTPTGTVDITGADVNCSITLAAGTGSCNVTFTSTGAKTLTATYNGDASHSTSSDTEPHLVDLAGTTTTINSDLPDPSAVGQSVTVNYSVAVTAPGAGTPTGTVTVSDGVDSCIGTVAAGTCNIILTTQGARTLTATYAGDNNFAGSISAGESHNVNGPPAVTVNQASGQTDPTNSLPINFDVVFSAPIDPTTFTTADIIQNGTATGITWVITNSGDNMNFTLAATVVTVEGTLIPSIAANTVQDPAGNNNTASTSTDNSVTYDTTNPAVTVNQASGQVDPTNASPINFTATFSKPINISTFTAADVTLGGTAPGTLTAVITEIAPNDGTTFNIAVSGMTGNGTVTASIGANTVQDSSGNNNTASTSTDNTVTYDTANPAVVTTSLTASYTGTGPANFTVTFNKNVDDPAGNTSIDDVTNPANYLLINKGTNSIANTTSCAGGVVADDTQVTVNSVSYNNVTFTSTVTLIGALPVGSYRLFICGTTSIVDLAGNPLNGGADYTFDFVVQAAPHPGGGTNQQNSLLPFTGFPQNKVTTLPLQPADKAYASYSDLRLEIPKMNVKMSIVGVPMNDKNWDVTWLNKDAGWLNGSAFPTWSGNSVLTGHVWDALNKPGPFAGLKELKYGDQIIIHAFGQIYTYEITENTLVLPSSITTVFKHADKSVITLVTCEEYKESSQTYSYRRMVRAVLVSVDKEK